MRCFIIFWREIKEPLRGYKAEFEFRDDRDKFIAENRDKWSAYTTYNLVFIDYWKESK